MDGNIPGNTKRYTLTKFDLQLGTWNLGIIVQPRRVMTILAEPEIHNIDVATI